MSEGTACRAKFITLNDFAACIADLPSTDAIALGGVLGALRSNLPDAVDVETKARLNELNGRAPPNLIARTSESIHYRSGQPAPVLIDVDTKGMPAAVKAKIDKLGGYWPALVSVMPALAQAGHLTRKSTSAGLRNTANGEQFPGSGGEHIYVLIADGADAERFLNVLHQRCWLAGLGWLMVGKAGQLLERSLVDRTVCAPERLVFEGAPMVEPPLAQDRREPVVREGPVLDTRTVCLDLSAAEQAQLKVLLDDQRRALEQEAAQVRGIFVADQAGKISRRTGCPAEAARRMAERQCGGVLLPGIELPFDDATLAGRTVADVLADPGRFDGGTLADPLEGPEYGAGKAKILRRRDGSLMIHSFAHGRTTYELRYDAAAVEAQIGARPAEASDTLARLAPQASLDATERQKLIELANDLSRTSRKVIRDKIKAAEAQARELRASTEKEQVRSGDRRPRLPAPRADDERLPVLRALDEILAAADDNEPPMRDLDGRPVRVMVRQPFGLHLLVANSGCDEGGRLPAPEMPLLTRHNKNTLAQDIEHHVAYISGKGERERLVALPPAFVEHYMDYPESRLPSAAAVITAPLVLPDGALLAPSGLHRSSKLVFCIDPALLRVLPEPDECGGPAAAAALDFLANKWLCDVATDFEGRCVLVAFALSILERALLPERPVFFVTAGKRGGGKTTALSMAVVAATGKKPAAAAWAGDHEERRKAMLAHLTEGLPALVWDNIPRGTAISCPTLEKVSTAETYSDRVLGRSENQAVPAHTIMAFTGNNIAPRGDLASRSLTVRLAGDRPDPENRQFAHADPVAWTLDNRAGILRALYTILLSNPLLRNPNTDAKTRFKTWWRMVGAAVEHAAKAAQVAGIKDARCIDFVALFASTEQNDEEAEEAVGVLDALRKKWGAQEFRAMHVLTSCLLQMRGCGAKPDGCANSSRRPPPVERVAAGCRQRASASG